jgi:hypothetical protein
MKRLVFKCKLGFRNYEYNKVVKRINCNFCPYANTTSFIKIRKIKRNEHVECFKNEKRVKILSEFLSREDFEY